MHRRLIVPGTLAALLAFATACEQTPAGPEASAEEITRSEALELAPQFEDMGAVMFEVLAAPSFSVSGGESGPALATTVTTQFTRTRECPAGGNVKVVGTIVNTRDEATRSASHQYNATRTENACAFPARRGTATVTINGNPSTTVTANQSWTNGTAGVRTVTTKGSFTWARSTGQSGTCNVDLTSTWNPATNTHTLKGTFCNQTIDVTRTRNG